MRYFSAFCFQSNLQKALETSKFKKKADGLFHERFPLVPRIRPKLANLSGLCKCYFKIRRPGALDLTIFKNRNCTVVTIQLTDRGSRRLEKRSRKRYTWRCGAMPSQNPTRILVSWQAGRPTLHVHGAFVTDLQRPGGIGSIFLLHKCTFTYRASCNLKFLNNLR